MVAKGKTKAKIKINNRKKLNRRILKSRHLYGPSVHVFLLNAVNINKQHPNNSTLEHENLQTNPFVRNNFQVNKINNNIDVFLYQKNKVLCWKSKNLKPKFEEFAGIKRNMKKLHVLKSVPSKK